jgi:hypothetical protein
LLLVDIGFERAIQNKMGRTVTAIAARYVSQAVRVLTLSRCCFVLDAPSLSQEGKIGLSWRCAAIGRSRHVATATSIRAIRIQRCMLAKIEIRHAKQTT